MRTTLAVVGLGWRQVRRDRLGLLFNFLVPVLVASVLVGIHSSGERLVIGMVDQDQGRVGAVLTDRLEQTDLFELRRFPTREALARAVRSRDVTAGVVVPVDADAPGGTRRIDLVGPPGVDSPSGVRAVVETSVAETAAVLQVDRSLRAAGATRTEVAAAQRALEQAPRARVAAPGQTRDDRIRDAVAIALIGTLVMFIFLNTMAASSWLAGMQEQGILSRVRATRASPWSIAIGIGLGLSSFALVQAALMLVSGSFLFGFTWTGWAGLLTVVAVVTLTAGAMGVLVGTVLPSPEAGATIAGPLGFLLAMLGGCLWPLEIVGPILQRIAHATPQAWAIEALRATGVDGGGVADVTTPIVVLLCFTAGLTALGGRRLWRLTTRG